MNATKYASLPDIDTAADVYETEDVFPTHETKQESSDEESGLPSRQSKGKDLHAKPEELDSSNLMDPSEAGKKFRKAEKRIHRRRIQYTYPPSPTSSSGRSSPEIHHTFPPQHHFHHQHPHGSTLAQRLTNLKVELAALEAELGDTQQQKGVLAAEDDEEEPVVVAAEVEDTPKPEEDKPKKSALGNVEPGELIKEVVDVKVRLEKIGKLREAKTGREKLVSAVLHGVGERSTSAEAVTGKGEEKEIAETEKKEEGAPMKMEVRDIAEMDRRLGELERAVGASSTTVDETTPLPPPLLPLLTRLNTQLTLLVQPRHIDNISRRLKLLLSDLDRLSTINNQHNNQGTVGSSQRRGTGSHLGHGQHGLAGSFSGVHPGSPVTSQAAPVPSAHPHTDALAPILNRLSPLLPHIPHILTRLRTLSTLHTNAAAFQSTLEALEEEQKRVRRALEELDGAVTSVEDSLKENENVVKGNVVEVERRVDEVARKVEAMSASSQ